MKLIKDLWNGEVSLVITYWVYGVIFLNLAVLGLTYLLEATSFGNMLSFLIVYFLIIITLIVHATVSIWNSSTKYIETKKTESKSAFWGYAARVVLFFALLRGFLDIMRELYILQ